MNEKDFKIILMSENVSYRNNLATKLRMEGFAVEFAAGGFHLLHLLERYGNYINMLICVGDMNDMSADEIIQLCRLSKTKTELPLLYISKDNDEELVCDMILTGANEIILQSNNMFPVVERVRKFYNIATKGLKAS